MVNDKEVVDTDAVVVEPKTQTEVNEEKRKQIEKQIIYYPLSEQLDLAKIDNEIESLDLSQSRLETIESFEQFVNLKSICFRQNLLKTLKTENLSAEKGLSMINELDFYDNQITKIENLNQLVTLENLDLSFNHFKKIENIECLVNLKKLFLVHNQIIKCENLETLNQLEMLELGDNQLRHIENIDSLKNLKEL